jgi:transposase InsO family protein
MSTKDPARGREKPSANRKRPHSAFTPADRLLVLETWTRSKLVATDFSRIVNVSPHVLYAWKRRFEEQGPAGLEDKRKGAPRGSRLPEATRRAILLMKESHEDWGVDRIHDMLLRTEGFQASATAITRLLKEEGYESEVVETKCHPDKVRRFERAKPNQLWQSDLFNFTLPPSSHRVYVVAFLDDRSRFITTYGVSAGSSGAFVRDVFRTGVTNFGAPLEVLTDRGPQYHSWRGKSAFTKMLASMGIQHILARPRHPETVGKTERFWKTLWQECLLERRPRDVEEARVRIGHFVDFYNFRRTHQGIDGLIPADIYFDAESEVRASMEARVAANALELAKHGTPRKPFYLTGRVGEQTLSLHAEGEKVVLTKEDGTREVVDLTAPGRRQEEPEPEEQKPEEQADEEGVA